MSLYSRLLLIFQILALILLPIAMFHKTSELFEFNKIILIYLISLPSLLISIFIHYTHKNIKLPKVFFIPLSIFIISQVIATLFSIDMHTSFFGYYGRFNGGLLSILAYGSVVYSFIVLIQTINRDKVISFIKLWIIASTVTAFMVVLWALPGLFGKDLSCLLFTGIWTNICWTDMFKPAERMFSTLGQPNWLGAYLVIIFFLSIGYFFQKIQNSSLIQKFLFYVWFILITFGILSTRSRSAILALIILFIVWLLVLFIFKIRKIISFKLIYLIILIVLISIIVIIKNSGISFIDKFLPELPKIKKEQVVSNTNSKTPIFVTDSLDIRKVVWKGAIEIIRKNPILGTGPETFAYAYYQVRPREHNLTSEWDYVYNKAHNEFLHISAGSGLVGIGAYIFYNMSMAVMMLYFIFKSFIQKKIYLLIQIGLFIAWISIHVTNITGFSTTVINWYFFIIPVISYYLFNYEDIKPLNFVNRKYSILLGIVLICIFIYGVLRIGFFYAADLYYARSDMYEGKGMHYERYADLSKALKLHYEHVYEDKFAYAAAQLALILSATEGSDSNTVQELILQSDKANLHTLTVAPKNIFYWRTRAKMMYLFDTIDQTSKYYEKGIDAIEKAIRLAPTDPRLYYTYAAIESMHGRNSKIAEDKKQFITGLYLQAIELKPDYRDALIGIAEWYEKNKENEKAKENYLYILENLNPNDEEAKNGYSRN